MGSPGSRRTAAATTPAESIQQLASFPAPRAVVPWTTQVEQGRLRLRASCCVRIVRTVRGSFGTVGRKPRTVRGGCYETTSAHGRLIMTIVMALAEFEREQTSERTKDAFAARADRGLWNGNHLFGYDLGALRKGYLVPNPDESAVVNFAFSEYLTVGSIKGVRDRWKLTVSAPAATKIGRAHV